MRIFGGIRRGPKRNASWVRLKEGELEGVVVGRGPVGEEGGVIGMKEMEQRT